MTGREQLRVAFVAGTLGQGGAEKQLVYMVRALIRDGVRVRVCVLMGGEYHEQALKDLGAEVVCVGRHASPAIRLPALVGALRDFRPHVLQSAHFYTNLYVALAAPMLRAVGLGAIRSDLISELNAHPFWGRFLLRRPLALIANSHAAVAGAVAAGRAPVDVSYLSNVIDLDDFDARQQQTLGAPPPVAASGGIVVGAVGRLVAAKRFDRLIRAVALARQQRPTLRACLVGEGPERERLEQMVRESAARNDFEFLGRRDDVPALLRTLDVVVVTSDHEGFPNVILEAMAARRPVITTPAGDAGRLVSSADSGFVVPFDDAEALAGRLVQLADAPSLRERLGDAGRQTVAQHHAVDQLGDRLKEIYLHVATGHHVRGLRRVLEA